MTSLEAQFFFFFFFSRSIPARVLLTNINMTIWRMNNWFYLSYTQPLFLNSHCDKFCPTETFSVGQFQTQIHKTWKKKKNKRSTAMSFTCIVQSSKVKMKPQDSFVKLWKQTNITNTISMFDSINILQATPPGWRMPSWALNHFRFSVLFSKDDYFAVRTWEFLHFNTVPERVLWKVHSITQTLQCYMSILVALSMT